MNWQPAKATHEIRKIARSKELVLSYPLHARNRLAERGLIVSDVLYVLKNGFVHRSAEPTKVVGEFCYRMDGRSPNSGGRSLGVVVIPDLPSRHLRVVTVMWLDEFATRAGSILRD